MNNGFPGSFTPMNNNMGLTCQPNFNGTQPGHCVLHHVDKTPASRFSHQVSAVQNRTMDMPRPPQKISIAQSERNKNLIASDKNSARLNISTPALANNKTDLQKQLAQAQSLLSKALAEQDAAKKDAAKKTSIANEKEKHFIKKWAYGVIMENCHAVKDRISEGNIIYSAIAQDNYQWQCWVDFRTQLIQRENAINHLDNVNLKVKDVRKHIDKITLEIKKIDAKTPVPLAKSTATAAPSAKPTVKPPVPAAKPVAKAPATAAKPAVKPPVPAAKPVAKPPVTAAKPVAKPPVTAAKPVAKPPVPAAKPVAKPPLTAAKPAAKPPLTAAKPAATPPTQNSDSSLVATLASHNFLSDEQRAQKTKEIAECQTALCKIGKEAQWAITDLAQGTSFAAGIVAGVPAGLYETVDGIVKTASSPAEAYRALKGLSDSGNLLGNLALAVKQSWLDRINLMEQEYQKGSISGAFNAGVEGGKLTTDIGGLVTGGAGLVKSGLVATEKAVVKVSGKADLVAKAVSEPSQSAKLTGQQALKNSPYLTIPPLEKQAFGNALVSSMALATSQQAKVTEQLLDIALKASITGITAMTLKDVADRITADELTHIIALSRAGDQAITAQYLDSLQDKYAPVHTGNTQRPETTLRSTAGSPSLSPRVPVHTGNNQILGQEVTHTGNIAGVTGTGGYILINPGSDPLSRKDIVYLSEKHSSKIDSIINETLSGKNNFTSSTVLTSDEALAAGLKFLGTGYKEIGKSGSGVYHSADGTKEFRIDSGSISGAHLPGVPHVHFGMKNPETGKYISNNHVPYKD